MKGRKVIPDSIKARSGTLRSSRKRGELTVSLSDKIPPPPDDLTKREKDIYFSTTNELYRLNLLQNLAIPAIVMYCTYVATWLDAREKINKLKIVYVQKNKKGEEIPKLNPYFRVMNESFDRAKFLIVEFGMTPSSWTKILGLAKKVSENSNDKDFT